MNAEPTLHVGQVLARKGVLFLGATGFLGKVTLSMLLTRYGGELDQIYVLSRRGSSGSARRRFEDQVATSEPFKPLWDDLGLERGARFLEGKCQVLEGDITSPACGLTPEQLQQLKGKVQIAVNCAGLVSFNPSLEVGLSVNTLGVRNVVQVCQALEIPLVHVSTSFVAGNRDGLVFEDEEVEGYFPRKGELDGRDFSLEQELLDCQKLVARSREKAEDKALTSRFRQRALDRLAHEGRDSSDEKTLRLAVGRERKLWLSNELTRLGMERAQHWGWPNTYTYTKSLGEQVISGTRGLPYAIVRPSIIESAIRYPFPGWNQGFTTSAPLCFAIMRGHREIPSGEKTILDIIPVDLVAGALIAITARTLQAPERRVYHLASGDVNPFIAQRSVELVGLYKRRHFRNKKSGNPFWNEVLARIEPQAVSHRAFQTRSAPLVLKGAKALKQIIDEVKPSWGAPKLSALLDRASDRLAQLEEQASSVVALVELFLPFIWENRYVFRCDNTRAVYQSMAAEDRTKVPWNPDELNWREYFLDVHLPGLEKWVFPGLEEETRRRTAVPAHRDLLELFEAAVHAYRHRVALRMVQGDQEVHFTYGEVHKYAGRIGSFLLKSGIRAGDRVLLISENRPEWGIAYFGILRSGATAVPVDPELPQAEVINIVRTSQAACCLISEQAARSLPGLFRALGEANLSTQVHSLAQALEGDGAFPEQIGPVKKSASPDTAASLIFTSGTTGVPKGVVLTHRNFASLIAKLASAYDIGVGDGLLSVLPLHHTFEFSCGFLLPLRRGAEITYLDDLTADRLGEVFETGRVTAMIGVPALWQLLHRKITQEFSAKPAIVEQGIRALLTAHSELRNRSAINLGKLLFWPVHRKLGGRLRFLVSGGSALPDEVQEAFYAMGFNITQGYGLTEAAPVLTVEQERNERHPGTVGKALPGVELRIDQPDSDGVGEVLARGPNIMAGYFQDREATEAVLEDGWLRTGDLGRLDSDGRLYLVGRKKDVILSANGRNVYPDELESIYSQHPHVKELSVVGLPDPVGGENVACLCVLDYKDRPKEQVRRELEEHFRRVSSELPFHRRIKVLRIWEGELPRTATRKVKRAEVVSELQRLERAAASGERLREVAVTISGAGRSGWLYPLLGEISQRTSTEIRPESHLTGELGFDSLMLTELAVALDQAGLGLPAGVDLSQVETVDELEKLIASVGSAPARVAAPKARPKDQAEEIQVPEALATVGKKLLSFGQRFLYGGIFDVRVSGKNFIPQNENFLVVANHTSHLDMGLIKVVLGEQGERLVALAARDYFFDTPLKRAYFENFTNLIPMDRHGSLRESLRMAGEALNHGCNLLIFPEGTRSPTGELLEFKATLGYLALTYKVDVLPIHVSGTFEALPKGAILPRAKDLSVRIGPLLQYAQLSQSVRGLARSESYRQVARLAQEAVKALRDGGVFTLQSGVDRIDVARHRKRPPSKSGGGVGRGVKRRR